MKNLMTYLRLVLAAAVSTAALAFVMLQTGHTVSAAPTPPVTPVLVTNTAAQAVPTAAQGTTIVSGDVGITGTPSVNIANTSPVLVRDADRSSGQPFNFFAQLDFTPTFAFANAGSPVDFFVPAGKRLVIENVSLQADVPTGQTVLFARVDATTPISLVLTVDHPGNYAAGEVFTATHRVFTVLEPGTRVVPTAFRNSGTGTGTVLMTISGYLVDVP